MVKPLDIAVLAIGAVASLCALLATALPYWQTGDRQVVGIDFKTNFGLWRYCFKVDGREDDCGKTDDITGLSLTGDGVEESLDATRAMLILGLICTAAAIFPVGLLFVFETYQKIIRLVAIGLFSVGGLFLMLGMAVFESKVAQDDLDHSGAFALDILGWVFSWSAAAVVLYSLIMKDND